MEKIDLEEIAKLIRYWILKMTTEAGSGHVTSSFSAVELMVGLMFGGGFKFQVSSCELENNDRLIFSKGHASPLFYALWAAAEDSGITEKDLMSLRKFGSKLEGHPTMKFPFTEAATGSLGQGLSVGLGMALNSKNQKLKIKNQNNGYRTYVLLGDSEMAEGQIWEAMQLAAYYKLNNLVAILDVNRLGQRGETMYGWNTETYDRQAQAFGWRTIVIDGHDLKQVTEAIKEAQRTEEQKNIKPRNQGTKKLRNQEKPVMIIAKTVKGKGVSFLENQEGWHGKTLSKEQLDEALKELREVDTEIRGMIAEPEQVSRFQGFKVSKLKDLEINLETSKLRNFETEKTATRKAYGQALVKLGTENADVVVLDGEVSNSTFAEDFQKVFPERFFEMFIAEQNMVGVAVGLAQRGKIPWVSTFAAFWTRAFDQIRMAAYSEANIKFCGSHAGVAIGEDGSSQMGLEDLALFRAIKDSVVLYPADAVSTVKLVEAATQHQGIVYLRTTRGATPVIYSPEEEFPIGGCKVLRQSEEDKATVVAAGVTVHEALKAYEQLLKEGIKIRVIDLYSVKPLDVVTLNKAAEDTRVIITVEDHYPEGGIGEAVMSALCHPELVSGSAGSVNPSEISRGIASSPVRNGKVVSLAVRKMPMSGTPEELLRYEEIDSEAIVRQITSIIG